MAPPTPSARAAPAESGQTAGGGWWRPFWSGATWFRIIGDLAQYPRLHTKHQRRMEFCVRRRRPRQGRYGVAPWERGSGVLLNVFLRLGPF
jgi:hypothetical protein